MTFGQRKRLKPILAAGCGTGVARCVLGGGKEVVVLPTRDRSTGPDSGPRRRVAEELRQ
jgi:hypothetical protein